MGTITFTQKGDFKNTDKFFSKLLQTVKLSDLDRYGKAGVSALSSATPVDSGETARSWYYEIVRERGYTKITWNNSHIEKGVPIAIILQYGHGTRNGGWVQGRDYINPAIQPIFDEIAEEAWKEVSRG